MRLADFILRDMNAIVSEWESFAASLLPAAGRMSSAALRDHAEQILRTIAKDLTTEQTKEEQSEKSMGRAYRVPGGGDTAAETHAILRARSGFDIKQLAAEYRALRASVLRLWEEECDPEPPSLDDVIRFNEAIDQALAESIAFFHEQVERSRNLLLGMLGHDMRAPLTAIVMTARHLGELNAGAEVSQAAARLIRSGTSIRALLEDLVDFNRTNLGLGINVSAADGDFAAIVAGEVEEQRAANPKRHIELSSTGDSRALCDRIRIQQMIRNLISNAIAYSVKDEPVKVALESDETTIRIEVKNSGPPLDPALIEELFNPLTRGPIRTDSSDSGHGLGLGLYIVREIARAHGGDVKVSSDAGHISFAVQLPRRRPSGG